MIQYLVFDVNKQYCAISIHDIKEVLRNAKLEQIPEQPKFIEGLLDVRGTLVPIINLRQRFLMDEAEESINQRILLIKTDDQLFGLKVDSVLKVDALETSDVIKKQLKKILIKEHFLSAMAQYEDKLVVIIDVNEIFNDIETDLLESVSLLER